MAIYDNERLVVKACKLFYEEELSQKEIAIRLGLSKPQICRMLSYAKEKGIVSFRITNPFEQEFGLERRLEEKYGLREAYVFSFDYASSDEMRARLGELCAAQLDKYLTNSCVIGVMSGKTIAAVAAAAHRLNRDGLEFVPLIGNIGSSGGEWHANSIARVFSEKTGGSYHLLNAPVVLQNEGLCAIFANEPSIRSVLRLGKECDTALVGIGDISENSTGFLTGTLNNEDISELKRHGAAASVCISYIDRNGSVIDCPLTRRSMGVGITEPKRVIAVAAGRGKLDAISAALKSGYISVFMTTLETAELL